MFSGFQKNNNHRQWSPTNEIVIGDEFQMIMKFTRYGQGKFSKNKGKMPSAMHELY